MNNFSTISLERLYQCHKNLQIVFLKTIKVVDCSILCGYRSAVEQERLFEKGKTKLHYPYSKHNIYPSNAIDVAPYPINWKQINRFYYFAGTVKMIGLGEGIRIRWGGDWDGDLAFNDQNFNDLVHFELIE